MDTKRRMNMSRAMLNRPSARRSADDVVLGRPLTDREPTTLLQAVFDWIDQKDRELAAQIDEVDRALQVDTIDHALTDQRQELTQQRRFLAEQRQQLIDEAAAEGKRK